MISNRNSKIVSFLSMVGIIILMAGNTYNSDMLIYKNAYNYNIEIDTFERAFVFIMSIFKKMHFTYEAFLFVVYTSCLLINVYITNKFYGNLHCMLFLYTVIQLAVDTTQFRNYIASTLLVVSIYYIYRKKIFQALIYMLIAISIHRVFLIYLPLVLIGRYQKYFILVAKYSAVIIIGLAVFMHFTNGSFLAEVLFKVFQESGKEGYFLTSMGVGFWLYCILHILNIVLLLYFRRQIKSEQLIEIFDYCLMINLYAVISFPLLTMSMSMYRIYRNLNVFNFICFSILYNSTKRNAITNKNLKYGMLLLIFSFIWLASYLIVGSNIYNYIFENNILI